MSNMDLFISLLGTADIKKKIAIGGDIIAFLSVPDNSIECEDIGGFVDGLVPWLQNSNFKVSQNGLDILGLLVDRLNEDFRPYLPSIVPSIIDRLGDAKDSVREKAHELITHLMKDTCPPQQLFDRLMPAFSHKNAKVREEIMLLFQETLNTHGVASLSVSKIVPSLVKLLSDPTPPVRDAAFNSLVEVFRHVGERVRLDLQKKHNVPPTKLPVLMAKFDEIRDSGMLLPTALVSEGFSTYREKAVSVSHFTQKGNIRRVKCRHCMGNFRASFNDNFTTRSGWDCLLFTRNSL